MGGEGHMLDMIRRLKDGKDLFPTTTPEEMERIIKDSEKKKEKDNNYFVWGTLIIMGVLIGCAVLLWALFN